MPINQGVVPHLPITPKKPKPAPTQASEHARMQRLKAMSHANSSDEWLQRLVDLGIAKSKEEVINLHKPVQKAPK